MMMRNITTKLCLLLLTQIEAFQKTSYMKSSEEYDYPIRNINNIHPYAYLEEPIKRNIFLSISEYLLILFLLVATYYYFILKI